MKRKKKQIKRNPVLDDMKKRQMATKKFVIALKKVEKIFNGDAYYNHQFEMSFAEQEKHREILHAIVSMKNNATSKLAKIIIKKKEIKRLLGKPLLWFDEGNKKIMAGTPTLPRAVINLLAKLPIVKLEDFSQFTWHDIDAIPQIGWERKRKIRNFFCDLGIEIRGK